MKNRIRELWKRSRLTQREVAVLLGVSEADVSRWEAEKRPLTPRVLAELAKISKVESWELVVDRKGLRQLTLPWWGSSCVYVSE